MLKVHKALIAQLDRFQVGRVSTNTKVIQDEIAADTLLVHLHGNTIAAVRRPCATDDATIFDIFDAGHRSKVTKARLNALLEHFAPNYKIISAYGHWWMTNIDPDPTQFRGPGYIWNGGATFKRGRQLHGGATFKRSRQLHA
jgi:hypothetical protein